MCKFVPSEKYFYKFYTHICTNYKLIDHQSLPSISKCESGASAQALGGLPFASLYNGKNATRYYLVCVTKSCHQHVILGVNVCDDVGSERLLLSWSWFVDDLDWLVGALRYGWPGNSNVYIETIYIYMCSLFLATMNLWKRRQFHTHQPRAIAYSPSAIIKWRCGLKARRLQQQQQQ